MRWQSESSRKIAQRYVITGQLVLETPASLSNGETNGTEIVILVDELEGKPLLTGASLAGALRNYLLFRELGYNASKQGQLVERLFGKALEDGRERMESQVIVDDALGEGEVSRREGVKIAGATRTAEEGMLFAAQVWTAGTTFDVRIELALYEDDPDILKQALAAAIYALGDGEIPLGGRKSRGYGRVRVRDKWKVCHYDMRQPRDLVAWLKDELHQDEADTFLAERKHMKDKRAYVRLQTTLRLCDSLLIRAASDHADNEHLTSNHQAVLSGTSLAGALRARALKIANTVNPQFAAVLVDDLFGRHGDQDDEGALTASRLYVEERPVKNGEFNYIQNRVKIDRFTGGAFETALFEERPIFAGDNTALTVNLELRYPSGQAGHARHRAQTGLLLLILKDLWTQDLPLGGESGIGRGRLQGQSGTMDIKTEASNDATSIALNATGLQDKQYASSLESFVQALWEYRGE